MIKGGSETPQILLIPTFYHEKERRKTCAGFQSERPVSRTIVAVELLVALPGDRAETLRSEEEAERTGQRTLPRDHQPRALALYHLNLSGLS